MNIVVDPGLNNTLVMSEHTSKVMKVSDKVALHFGQFKKTLDVTINSVAEPDKIIIPGEVSKLFSIPDLPYEVKLADNVLTLGPVIGFMNNRRFYRKPDSIASRFVNYGQVKGLVYIFGKDQIDTKKQVIRGKYYNPETNSFIEAVLPYPSVIYLRTNLTPELHRHFKAILGIKNIYNYPFRSNKLYFWRYVSRNTEVRKHLPETIRLVSMRNTLDMLSRHRAVYLKPYDLSRGRGIYRLSQEEKEFVLEDSDGGKWTTPDVNALSRLFREKLRRKYLVQQEIPFKYGEHKADFRIYLQKDKTQQWKPLWVDARLAEKGSIITNLRNRWDVLPGLEGIKLLFGSDDRTAAEKIAEVTHLCIKALNTLEYYGQSLGDVAIDFLLDKNMKPWLLEVQPDYFGDVFIREYLTGIIHPNSFDYAKALSGFS